MFVRPFSGLFRRCLFRRVGYSGLFQQGVSDFFWLGRFWVMCWRGITVVTEWSEWSKPASPVGMFRLLQRTTEEEAFARAGEVSEYTRVSGAWLVKTLGHLLYILNLFDTVALFHIGNLSAAVSTVA